MSGPTRIKKRADVTPALVEKVRACAASGCSFPQTALITGVAEDSLRRWMAATYNEGKAQSIGRAGAALFNMAVGDQTKGTRPNLGALIFYLKCQGGWRETTGIVFEEAKPTDENQSRLIELLESRFSRLASMQAKKKEAKEQGDAPAVPG